METEMYLGEEKWDGEISAMQTSSTAAADTLTRLLESVYVVPSQKYSPRALAEGIMMMMVSLGVAVVTISLMMRKEYLATKVHLSVILSVLFYTLELLELCGRMKEKSFIPPRYKQLLQL